MLHSYVSPSLHASIVLWGFITRPHRSTVQGVYDLFRLPYDQYMDDGRIVWGIQRGASSFTTSSGVAIVELTSRALETVQWIAQMAYDLVTPTDRHGPTSGHTHSSRALVHQHQAPHQPLDFREGVANAYDVVTAVSCP